MNITNSVRRVNAIERRSGGAMHRLVGIDDGGSPQDLLGGGEHFEDAPRRRNQNEDNDTTPMDEMLQSVVEQELLRPLVRDRR